MIEKLKTFLTDYVQEITKKSGGKNQYVCPLCGSGTGNNHSGAFTVYPDTDTYFCFACQKFGNIFTLYQELNNISDFKTALDSLARKYGITDTNNKDYTKFFTFAENNLYQTDYLTKRGLSLETQRRFHCGYVSDYKYAENQTTPAIIIPTSDSSFMWRSTTENIKQKRGTAHILNPSALKSAYCFVVEGEIDCMSVTECGFACIGLGSTSNIKKIFDFDISKTILIIALDNDEAGKKATAELEKLCITHRTAFITANSDVWGDYKDANELLVKDRKRLTDNLYSLVKRTENFNHTEYFSRLKLESDKLEWQQPESFDSLKKTIPFPMKSLPPLLSEYLQAVSDYVQVSPEMAILPLLSVLALCVQGKAVIKSPGNSYTEPLNLYTITIASPGERKSGVFKEIMRPVEEYQAYYNQAHATEISEYRLKYTFLENQKQKALRKDFNTAKNYNTQLLNLDKKVELVLTASDATPEALALKMHEQDEKIGVIDDEGTIFDVLSGIYSNGMANINIFLKSYDSSPYTILRCGKDDIMLKNPMLTIGLMVQPDHFSEAMGNKQFTGRGFIHRFLFAFPENKAGTLQLNTPDIPETIQRKYTDLVKRLLCMPTPSLVPVIQCNDEATLIFSDYFYHLQKEMRDGGTFEYLKEWASKHFGRALRIAGILHVCEHTRTERLTGQTAMNAVKIAEWAETHALVALSDSASEPIEIKNAKYILKKLQKTDKDSISKYDLLRMCRALSADDCNEPLAILEDMCCIKREKIARAGGGNPKELIKINPFIKK